MCGIIAGFTSLPILPKLVDGLKKLSYRGYDSWAVSYFKNNEIITYKELGNNISLSPLANSNDIFCGFGHTRWATNGSATLKNTHPIYSKYINNECYVIHNGIIENAQEIFDSHCKPYTETDTEAISILLSMNLVLCNTFEGALIETCKKLKGQYAFAAITPQYSNRIGFACNGSPIVFSSNGFLCSDINSISDYLHNDKYFVVPDKSVGVFNQPDSEPELRDFKYKIVNAEEKFLVKTLCSKNEHSTHMLNEINQQIQFVKDYEPNKEIKTLDYHDKPNEIKLFGCGSSYNAALLGAKYLKAIPFIKSSVEYATELAEEGQLYENNDEVWYIGLTQSGETKDTLSAFEKVRAISGFSNITFAVHNNPNSRAGRLLVSQIDISCGPEFGVAATKTFTAQCLRLLELSYRLFYGKDYCKIFKWNISKLDLVFEKIINGDLRKRVDDISDYIDDFHNILYLGRGLLYPIAKEGSLKMKEVCYRHAEAIHVSEIKHGPLALLDENTLPIVMLSGPDALLSAKIAGNINEILARSKEIVVICDDKTKEMVPREIREDRVLCLPFLDLYLQPLIFNIALQLFSYNIAVANGINPDFPRNIAKCISV